MKPIVVIESPLAGNVVHTMEVNIEYLKRCIRDCLLRGEAPMASHGLYAQPGVFDDAKPEERKIGMEAGWAFYHVPGVRCVVYDELGVSPGMEAGIAYAKAQGVPVEYRNLRHCNPRVVP